MNPLQELQQYGQSVWLDLIRRGLIASGELTRMVREDAVVGITSNPTIFEKAISGSTDYDAALRERADQDQPVEALFFELAIEDIAAAADVLRPVYEATRRRDGYVSLEVSPLLAGDSAGSIAMARDLFGRLARPNVMIKIPATPQGLPAITTLIAEGINVNVTLMFAVSNYLEVARAYLKGLALRRQAALPLDGVTSVASFFVSRVDTAVDAQLEERVKVATDPAERHRLQALMGKAAIANAKMAYAEYQRIFEGPEFASLRAAGAGVQRCLWASTGTKNPAYSDVMYVEELIGKDTINTMPPATMKAFKEHGEVRPSLTERLDEAVETLRALRHEGIDLDAITRQLQVDGVKLFADSFAQLLTTLEQKRVAFRHDGAPRYTAALGPLQATLDAALARVDGDHLCRRIWEHDDRVWKSDASAAAIVKNRLGWLTIADQMVGRVPELRAFAERARADGYTRAVLLGMGGSSLCPEVLARTFGARPGFLPVTVLDSTDPGTITAASGGGALTHTLFVVSTKSGTTLETLSLFRYFFARAPHGEQFVAITDPGTPLDHLAEERHFRATFHSPADVGGRYSALTYFGLVPAALQGLDLDRLLDRAERMVQACDPVCPAADNPGAYLGTALATLAQQGRDKVTVLAPPAIASLGSWVEQLLAESTGKEGRGLVPVVGEPPGAPEEYGQDRLFVYLPVATAPEPTLEKRVEQLRRAKLPVITLPVHDTYDLGGEFFRWEFATAVAGALLGVNAFDEPNVQEAKDLTASLLRDYSVRGRLADPPAMLEVDDTTLFADAALVDALKGARTLREALRAHLERLRAGDYLALTAYLEQTRGSEGLLEAMRARVRADHRVATTLGFGPRYLHSTGQLHKGGPNTGVFVQITAGGDQELAIPEAPYGFATLKQAQARADLDALLRHGRRVLAVHLRAPDQLAKLRDALAVAAPGR
jgi:transaldolase/glucose-6-phosphate isomerase